MKGKVMRSTGSWYDVCVESGEVIASRTRGKLRLKGYKESNPIAVGDIVELEMEGQDGAITKIYERKNHILRQSVKKTGHAHVLAANIDQAMLMATITRPRTSTGFIDRFLVTAESFDIPQLLVFNKRDILSEEELAVQLKLIEQYKAIDIPCVMIAATEDSTHQVLAYLKNKTTLIAGHSGVGKSTLLNRLSPGINQTIGNISEFSLKGTHTTTFAEMFRLDTNTFVIDTPGIKEWGLINMRPGELSDNFPEMRSLRASCKFGYSCLHQNEPGCAVIQAVQQSEIAISRYQSYISMLIGEDNRK